MMWIFHRGLPAACLRRFELENKKEPSALRRTSSKKNLRVSFQMETIEENTGGHLGAASRNLRLRLPVVRSVWIFLRLAQAGQFRVSPPRVSTITYS